ncbi:MAG: hypothetical protein WCA56_20520 [Xanthobacteraceae bacterium]
MLADWHEFYALLGGAAGALLSLLFVVASIGASVMSADTAGGTRTFMSPVAFHYANVLFLGLVALIPAQTWESFGLTLVVAAAGSLAYSLVILVRVLRDSRADMIDNFAYGAVPAICYTAGLVSSVLILKENAAGLDVLAGAALLLLVINIRNAWDLMLSMARRAAAQRKKTEL